MDTNASRLYACALVLAGLAMNANGQENTQGQRIAREGAAGVAACASCHGARGEGNASAGFPRIAGLPVRYFTHQMQSFADGKRENQVMTPIAKSLSRSDAEAVARYYSGVDTGASAAKAGQHAATSSAQTRRGSQLANVGDEALRVQACVNCHGPNGAGEPPVMPPLAGQHESYLLAALKEWKSGSRKTDASQQMPSIAGRLREADMKAVAAWYASLPVPAPAASRAVRSATAGPSVSGQAAPKQAGDGRSITPGTGSEQGAGVTGGSQGPGGSAASTEGRQQVK